MSFQAINANDLAESKTNPRKHFDAAALSELAASIKQKGLLQPLLVRKNGKGYEVVAGARRYRAAKLAGLADIPCVVRELTDTEALEIQVIENLQREDIHPLEEAQGYQALMKTKGYDVDVIAEKVGKSISYIYARQKLLSLSPEAQKEFLSGEISAGHAILLARLQDHYQTKALTEMLWQHSYNGKRGKHRKKNSMSVRDLSTWIREELCHVLAGAPFDTKSATLLRQAGSCTDCPKRTGADKLGLFDEDDESGKAADECLDGGCWDKKVAAHWLELRNITAKKTGKTVIFLAGSWRGESAVPGQKVHRTYDVQTVKKEHPDSVAAIVVDGKQGEVRFVKLTSRNYGGISRPDPAAQRHRAAVKKRNTNVQRDYRASLAAALKDKWPKAIDGALLQSLVIDELEDCYSGALDMALKEIGLPAYKRKYKGPSIRDHASAAFAKRKWTDAELMEALRIARTASDVYEPSYGYSGEPDQLVELAKGYGIDTASIKAAAQEKHPMPKKPEKKAPAVKKATKKTQTSAKKKTTTKKRVTAKRRTRRIA